MLYLSCELKASTKTAELSSLHKTCIKGQKKSFFFFNKLPFWPQYNCICFQKFCVYFYYNKALGLELLTLIKVQGVNNTTTNILTQKQW